MTEPNPFTAILNASDSVTSWMQNILPSAFKTIFKTVKIAAIVLIVGLLIWMVVSFVNHRKAKTAYLVWLAESQKRQEEKRKKKELGEIEYQKRRKEEIKAWEEAERIKSLEPKPERPNFKVNIDRDKGFFRKKEITEHEAWYLKQCEFIEFPAVGLKGGREETYLLMPRSNETDVHFFLCKAIEELLVKDFGCEKVKLWQTTHPDVVFDVGGEKWAIEVETGSMAEHPEKMKVKVRQLKKEYGGRWFFVVSSWRVREKYVGWGRTLVRREVVNELRRIFEKRGAGKKGAGGKFSEVHEQPRGGLESFKSAKGGSKPSDII